MRIRGTKPEYWRSKLIASVSWDARFVLKALESYVDDNGVGEDDVNLLVGDCFLHDLIREPSRTLARVSEAISELHQAGLVWRYTGNGKDLLFVSFWETVQRIDKPQAGRNPRPDGTLNYKDSEIRGSVATPREGSRTLAPVTGEQGNRGTGEQNDSSDEESLPRKRGTTRGTRIPEPFIVSGEMRQDMTAECPLLDIDTHTRRFVDYWRAQPGQKGVKVDWPATWRNWMRRAADEQGNRRLTPTERAKLTVAAGRTVAGQQITSLDAKEIAS
jgi:hypothetical protein